MICRKMLQLVVGVPLFMYLIVGCSAITTTSVPVEPTTIPRIESSTPIPPKPTPEAGPQHIVDLVEQVLITVGVRGAGIDTLTIQIQSNTDDPLKIEIPSGTYFVADIASSQNMVIRYSVTLPIKPHEALEKKVDAACANLHRDQPGEKDTFSIRRAPEQPELSKLMTELDSAGVDFNIEQAAVWIVTDDATYVDLGILVGGIGFSSRTINENVAVRAMLLVEQAGIDLPRRAIWKDRELLATHVTEPDLITWLGDRGVTGAGTLAAPAIPISIIKSFESKTTPNPGAVFSPLTFTDGLDENFRPLNPGKVFQKPVGHLYVLFSCDGMTAGSQWTALWYRGRELVHYETKPWDGGSGGYGYTDWNPSPELWIAGTYVVQIFIGEQFQIDGEFLIED